MRVILYTDGAANNAYGAASSIIMSDTSVLGIVVKRYEGKSSTEVELRGWYNGLNYVDKCLTVNDNTKIIIYTDAKKLADKFQYIKDYGFIQSCSDREIWEYLLNISQKYNVQIRYTKGHRHINNLNSLADKLAKASLRFGVDKCFTAM